MRAALILAGGLALGLAGAAPARTAETGRPDEVALRYYATQKQAARVEAEIARLRRRHPGWQPPADLWTAEPGGEDEAPFWDLFSAGRTAELDAAIRERARTEPGWRPSGALAGALARRLLRDEALALAKAGRWGDLAALADARRADVETGDAELLWVAAEAYGRTERAPDALALLRATMEGSRFSPEERRVGVLRGMAVLPMAEIERLVASRPAGEFEPIRIDLARGRISAVLHDEAGIAVSPEDLAAFEAHAEAAPDPNQAGLVAWHAFKRRDYPGALAWFKRAISRGGDAMVAHGLAHTLRQLGLRREAEEVAYAWREPLVNNTLLFIDLLEADLTKAVPPAIEPERLRRYAEVTAATASGEGAQALAWYAYNNCQFETALGWFRRAVAWFPKEATVYGYALSLRRMRQQRLFVETVNRYDGLFPKVIGLLFDAQDDRPMPCEGAALRPAQAARARSADYLDLSGAAAPGQPAARGRVPMPEEVGAVRAAPVVRRSEFPIAVQMENDLRVSPTGGTALADARWAERAIGRAPTTARRVPGVGPMPYERFGFALLPAWTGEERASSPTAAEQPAPAGTLWSDERAPRAEEAAVPAPARPVEIARTGALPAPAETPREALP